MALSVLLLLAIAGCNARSISDSGYRARSGGSAKAADTPFYQGELSEFEVLGISSEATVTQEEISRFLEARQRLVLPKGSSLMLIQSGAMIPDDHMIRALEKYYTVATFTGIPADRGNGDYAMSLRLAAAKGGCEKIMVYWGVLETAQKSTGAKAISWVPVIGGVISDESQEMRIRLKVALIDVKTGQWETFSPEPFQNTAVSARYTRESVDQGQVAVLKAIAYSGAVEHIVKRYAK